MSKEQKQASTEELKDVIDLCLSLAEAAYVVAKDGQLDFTDIGHVWSVIEQIGPAVIGLGKVPSELDDLASDEVTELSAYIVENCKVPDADSKLVLEKVLKAFGACYEVYLAVGRK